MNTKVHISVYCEHNLLNIYESPQKKIQTKVVQGQMKYILCWTHYSISCTGFRILEQELLCNAYI